MWDVHLTGVLIVRGIGLHHRPSVCQDCDSKDGGPRENLLFFLMNGALIVIRHVTVSHHLNVSELFTRTVLHFLFLLLLYLRTAGRTSLHIFNVFYRTDFFTSLSLFINHIQTCTRRHTYNL